MTLPAPPKKQATLEGLKAIAWALQEAWHVEEVSIWRAWRYCTTEHDPLPHYRVGRTVCAFAARVEAWAVRQPMWRRNP